MAKVKQSSLPTKWFVIIGIIVVLLVAFFYLKKNNPSSSPQLELGTYQLYQNSQFGFSIQYPNNWEMKYDTQVFENGDAITFGIEGPTQKPQTELTDGAQVTVSKPFTIKTELTTWVKEYFSPQAKFSKMTLTKYPFEAVEDCSNLGCMKYYYTLINGQVYGVTAFADGTNQEKAAYENAILYMLKSLQFKTPENSTTTMTEEEAISKVKAFSEVVDYLRRVPTGLVAVNGEDDTSFMVQVYEIKDGHTATFNWYNVDKTTGVVEKQF